MGLQCFKMHCTSDLYFKIIEDVGGRRGKKVDSIATCQGYVVYQLQSEWAYFVKMSINIIIQLSTRNILCVSWKYWIA